MDYNDYELINFIYEGDEDANNIMIEKYLPLIKSISLRMLKYCGNNGIEYNDLKQEGMIGLTYAVNTFSQQRNSSFFTYAKTCIERKVISSVISSNRLKHKFLNESISYDSDDNILDKTLKDEKNNPEKIVTSVDIENHLMDKIKKKLTDFEDQVFSLMLSEFTYKEIADILDRDPKSIDNAIQRIKNKVKEAINEDK